MEPHVNYTNHVFTVLDNGIPVKGIAHITGGGLIENIPRVVPSPYGVFIEQNSWPSLSVFDIMKRIGNIGDDEMFRTFNMGIGMVFIVENKHVELVKESLKNICNVYEVGIVTDKTNGVKIL